MDFSLPIGSVVLLKDSDKRVMIVGLKQKEPTEDKIWDYSGCLYPEGIVDPERMYLFDNDQIEHIFYVGYLDQEGLAYSDFITKDSDENEEDSENND